VIPVTLSANWVGYIWMKAAWIGGWNAECKAVCLGCRGSFWLENRAESPGDV